MTINLEESTDIWFDFDYENLAKQVIEKACEYENFPYEAEVNLMLVDNAQIHRMNMEYRRIDRPTDVLSFPLLAYETAGDFSHLEDSIEDNFNPDTGEIMLGDIIISVDKVNEQAACYGHSTEREYAFLIVHSMLHLFGYDHMEAEERSVMEQKQSDILNTLGIVR